MRHFIITVFGTIVGIFIGLILLIILLAGIGAAFAPSEKQPESVVLSLDLTDSMNDQAQSSELFGDGEASIVNTVRKLHQAKSDATVKGLYIRANSYGMPPAQAEEIRLAILDFQASGKFVVAHAQGFEGTSLSNYVAVSAAQDIWVQDTAGFSAAGYRAETPFYGGVFEKFDAVPQFEQFKEYKSAANSYTQTDYTDAHRYATEQMLESLYTIAVGHIAQDRDISISRVEQLLEGAPHSAETALEAGLIDTLGHYAASKEHALKKAGDNAQFLSLSAYEIDRPNGPLIALIGGQGAIMPGNSASPTPFSNSTTMGSDTISQALTDAAENERVKAIIFRVDSPGGSAIASDQMWDAVIRAKEAGKPIILSMGQYAASGGYYVAAPADKIVALPTTLTGSIGVLGGKVVLDKTFEKIGYNIEPISIGGDYTAAYSAIETWDQKTRAAFRGSMEDIYVDFTSRVAEGRGMSMEEVEEIARGRVWTGAQALEVGLVDEIGGLMRAIELAKEAAEIDADEKINIRTYPRAKTFQEEVQSLMGGSVQVTQNIGQIGALLNDPTLQSVLAAKQQAALMQSDKSLLATLPQIK